MKLVGVRPKEELAQVLDDAMIAWVVLLRAGTLAPGTYTLPWGSESAKHIQSLGGVAPPDLAADGSFTFTAEERTLLARLWYGVPTWQEIERDAIPPLDLATWTTDPEHPYGDTMAPWAGAASAFSWQVIKDGDGQPALSATDLARFNRLQADLFAAALLMQATAKLTPGEYLVPYPDGH